MAELEDPLSQLEPAVESQTGGFRQEWHSWLGRLTKTVRDKFAEITTSIADLTAALAGKANISDVNAALALKANIASPALTGNPTAPTPAFGDNDTTIPTTAFVQAAISAAIGGGSAVQAVNVVFAPAGTVSSTNVQAAIQELDGDIQALVGATVTLPWVPTLADIATRNLASFPAITVLRFGSGTELCPAVYQNKGSTQPQHDMKAQSLDGVWFELAESRPNFLQFGADPTGVSDAAIAFNRWLKYCDYKGFGDLVVPTGSYVFTTRPNAIYCRPLAISVGGNRICWGRSILGSGVANSSFYVNYNASQDFNGLLHIFPNAGGGAVTIRDLGITSSRTDFSGGCAIAGMAGKTTGFKIGGTITAGNVLTVNFNYDGLDHIAQYTVGAGETAESIARNFSIAINSAIASISIGVWAVSYFDMILCVFLASTTVTVSSSSTGATTITTGIYDSGTGLSNQVHVGFGHIFLSGLEISSTNGWSFPLYLDGVRSDVGPLGVRSSFLNDCNFFGGNYAAVRLRGVSGFSANNCQCVLAGGNSGALELFGTSVVPSQNFKWDGGGIDSINLDFAAWGTITAGKVLGSVTNTPNTDHVKIMSNIAGSAQNNWTNSFYVQ